MDVIRITLLTGLSAFAFETIGNLSLSAAPLGSAFSYQGRLSDDGRLPTARYDLRFRLFQAATGGTPAGQTVINENVLVNDGLFQTTVDFGTNVFTGVEYWMEVGVRAGASTDAFTLLDPRQILTPVPYAIYAKEAGSVPAGAISGAALQDGSVVRSINGLRDDFRIV